MGHRILPELGNPGRIASAVSLCDPESRPTTANPTERFPWKAGDGQSKNRRGKLGRWAIERKARKSDPLFGEEWELAAAPEFTVEAPSLSMSGAMEGRGRGRGVGPFKKMKFLRNR
jgi:hypothetical protein